jgi:hypothetical protein
MSEPKHEVRNQYLRIALTETTVRVPPSKEVTFVNETDFRASEIVRQVKHLLHKGTDPGIVLDLIDLMESDFDITLVRQMVRKED